MTAPDRDSALYRRWQTLQLIKPVSGLTERAAPRADFDHRAYDLDQLALRAIDFVVHHQASIDGSVTPDRIVDHLTQTARQMSPADTARPWSRVASITLNSLLNDGRPHEATWREPATDDDEWAEERTYRYRLLRLVDGEDGPAVTATDEAIVLYLQALDADLADQAMALKLLVEVQMKAGAFDKALATARQATRTAQGLAASLREKLDDTRRDVTAVDWRGEMPAWLTGVLGQLEDQLERDRQLKVLAVRAGGDPDAAGACRAIVSEVRRSEEVWVQLEARLQQAIPVYLAAQEVQRFQPRGLAAAIDLETAILDVTVTADAADVDRVADTFAQHLAPPIPVSQWVLDDLMKTLLRPPQRWERTEPELDDVDELADAVGESIGDDIADAAAAVLGRALERPMRLSELLAAARACSDAVEDVDRLCDVIWGAALYVYVADGITDPDTMPRRADIASALTQLVAVDDRCTLDDGRFHGPDLLLLSSVSLAALDDEAVQLADGSDTHDTAHSDVAAGQLGLPIAARGR